MYPSETVTTIATSEGFSKLFFIGTGARKLSSCSEEGNWFCNAKALKQKTLQTTKINTKMKEYYKWKNLNFKIIIIKLIVIIYIQYFDISKECSGPSG